MLFSKKKLHRKRRRNIRCEHFYVWTFFIILTSRIDAINIRHAHSATSAYKCRACARTCASKFARYKSFANKPRGISCCEIGRRVISNRRLHLREKRNKASTWYRSISASSSLNGIQLDWFAFPSFRVGNNCTMTNEFEGTKNDKGVPPLRPNVN